MDDLVKKIGGALIDVVEGTGYSIPDLLVALATFTKEFIKAYGDVNDSDYVLKAWYIHQRVLEKMSPQPQESPLTWAAALAENLEQLLRAVRTIETREVAEHDR